MDYRDINNLLFARLAKQDSRIFAVEVLESPQARDDENEIASVQLSETTVVSARFPFTKYFLTKQKYILTRPNETQDLQRIPSLQFS